MEFTIVYNKETKDVKINGVDFQYETTKKLTTQKFNEVLRRMYPCVEISRKDDKATKLLTVVMSGERTLSSFLSGFQMDTFDLCI